MGALPLRLEEWRLKFTPADWAAVLEGVASEEEDRLRRDTSNGWAAEDPTLRDMVERVWGEQHVSRGRAGGGGWSMHRS